MLYPLVLGAQTSPLRQGGCYGRERVESKYRIQSNRAQNFLFSATGINYLSSFGVHLRAYAVILLPLFLRLNFLILAPVSRTPEEGFVFISRHYFSLTTPHFDMHVSTYPAAMVYT